MVLIAPCIPGKSCQLDLLVLVKKTLHEPADNGRVFVVLQCSLAFRQSIVRCCQFP